MPDIKPSFKVDDNALKGSVDHIMGKLLDNTEVDIGKTKAAIDLQAKENEGYKAVSKYLEELVPVAAAYAQLGKVTQNLYTLTSKYQDEYNNLNNDARTKLLKEMEAAHQACKTQIQSQLDNNQAKIPKITAKLKKIAPSDVLPTIEKAYENLIKKRDSFKENFPKIELIYLHLAGGHEKGIEAKAQPAAVQSVKAPLSSSYGANHDAALAKANAAKANVSQSSEQQKKQGNS